MHQGLATSNLSEYFPRSSCLLCVTRFSRMHPNSKPHMLHHTNFLSEDQFPGQRPTMSRSFGNSSLHGTPSFYIHACKWLDSQIHKGRIAASGGHEHFTSVGGVFREKVLSCLRWVPEPPSPPQITDNRSRRAAWTPIPTSDIRY